MKKIMAFIFVLMFFANAAKAQYVNIPDSNFRAFLKTKYPSCFNSAGMMDTTCGQIVSENFLFVSSTNAVNLDGVQYFKNLESLYVFDNTSLKFINKLPKTLTDLICSRNGIDSLSDLPNSLKRLNCTNSFLKKLPTLPTSLKELFIDNNSFTDSDFINLKNNLVHLKTFSCSLNNVSILPKLSDSLESLYMSGNKFIAIPQLPKYLKNLDCSYNQFLIIDNLPESLRTLVAYDSLPICFGKLPQKLQQLLANYGSSVKCLPNYPDSCIYYISSVILINSFPIGLCNPTNNPNHCQSFPQIQSNIFIDNNLNGIKDSNEIYKKNARVQLSNSNYTFTNSNGNFQIAADSIGSYTLTVFAPHFYTAVPSTINLNFSNYDTLVNLPDIALQPNTLKDSLSIVTTPINFAARPGFRYAYNIQYENVGTTILSPSINFSYDNNLLIFDSSSNNAVVNNGSSLNLSQGIFAPGQTGSFTAYFKVKATAAIGTNLLAAASISAGNCAGVDSVTSIIRGSYDPNDKYATPTLTLQDIVNKKYINYTIRFQNTGTDTAFNVVISDSLSGYLKTNNLKGITSSHPCKFTLKNGVAYFEFIDINLPDSNTNKLGSNGFVKFQILADENVTAGTVIPNKAYIYFDYNKSIVTNITTTTIQNPLPLTLVNFGAISKQSNEISVYWATSNEINTKYFIIEVSADGSNFKPAAELAAIGLGDNSYSYSVPSVNVVYIRLKIVDKDGKVAYSKIIKISETKNSGITISPNPAKNYLNITVNKMDFNNTQSKIINSVGMVVKSFILKPGPQAIDISDLVIGVYYLRTGVQTIKVFVEK
jgi:hypothetical protein